MPARSIRHPAKVASPALAVRGLVVQARAAPDEPVQRWQHRMEPVQKRVFGGCHLTRPIVPLLQNAGFEIRDVDRFYEDGAPKFLAADSLGVAVSP